MDWEDAIPKLQQPLDPKHIRPAPRGKFGDYLDAYHVISEANRIFGEGGWSYSITRLEKVSEQIVDMTDKKGDRKQFRVGYLATVRVDVGGVSREGAAVGDGVGDPRSLADHHESAVKEAETNALKRALRSFGNTFGLALYDKDRANVGKPEATPGEKRDWLKAQIPLAQSADKLRTWMDRPDVSGLFDGLPEPMQNEVKAAFDQKFNELQEREAA